MEEGKDQGRRPELVGGGLIRSMGGWSKVLSLRGKKETMEYDARILGEGDFVARIRGEAEPHLKRQVPANEREQLINQIIEEICKQTGTNETELRMGGRRRKISETRAEVSYRLNREFGIPAAEIARHLGLCTSAIAKAIEKCELTKK